MIVACVGGAFVCVAAAKVGFELQAIGGVLFGATLAALVLTAILNPGLGEVDNETETVVTPLMESPYCPTCRAYQSTAAVHCLICNVCIEGRDHHCPWVGKCIGTCTQTYFTFFTCGLLASTIYIVTCSVLT